jgi:biotin carboxylase
MEFSKNKSILIVGAGMGQLPAIQRAKKMGLKTITVDRDADAPGMVIADESYEIDIIDKDSILQLAEKKSIDGILTLQSDHGVPAVGYVNDQMGLPGVSFETANDCSNKTKCRVRLAKENCSQPHFRFVGNDLNEANDAISEIGLPCVVKAPDSSGSRGIVKVDKPEDIESALKEAFKYSRQDKVIVEEYVEGIEFGAQTFSVNGKCELVLMHNDTLSDPPFMIPIGHSFPFTELNKSESVNAEKKIKEAVEAIGIENGPANIDLILDKKSKEIKVIEIGARIGATCLPELVEHFTGIDWVKQSIYSALGMEVHLKSGKKQPVAAMILTSPEDGFFTGYRVNNDLSDTDLVAFELTASYGDEVNKLRKGTDRIGKVITTGHDAASAELNARSFCNSIEYFITRK